MKKSIIVLLVLLLFGCANHPYNLQKQSPNKFPSVGMSKQQVLQVFGLRSSSMIDKKIYQSTGGYTSEDWMIYRWCSLFGGCVWNTFRSTHYDDTVWIITFRNSEFVTSIYY